MQELLPPTAQALRQLLAPALSDPFSDLWHLQRLHSLDNLDSLDNLHNQELFDQLEHCQLHRAQWRIVLVHLLSQDRLGHCLPLRVLPLLVHQQCTLDILQAQFRQR